MLITDQLLRAQITVTGTVQGVGFRPFVFSLASKHALRGFVRNEGGAVHIEVVGRPAHVDQFLIELKCDCPPLAKIDDVVVAYSKVSEEPEDFSILQSSHASQTSLKVPPDAATCDQCLTEIRDPANRRYLYPFTNCTNCGPRFTVIESLPYDRHATTLKCFPMCAECQEEYGQPANRRFHAQPNACWICGPQLFFVSDPDEPVERTAGSDLGEMRQQGTRAIDKAIACLKAGEIVAIKGLGGFHLACDAANQQAVMRLRQRKRRNSKPFAVMFSQLDQLRSYCDASKSEEHLLTGVQRPIVLVRRKNLSSNALAADVSNELDSVGAMLPYTPLQHLLLERFGAPLVMTSGNLHEEPIAMGNREAIRRLADIADSFLLNDRDICCRFDDSVTRLISSAPVIIRRARGIAPETLTVPLAAKRTVLALGGQLKTTVTFLREKTAYMSQHLGDTSHIDTVVFLKQAVDHYKQLFDLEPQVLACDLHPDYQTTSLAEEWSRNLALPLVRVQHHHAHIASCMAEHGLVDPVIGVAFDGSGYGDDGTVWGGEFLLCDLDNYRRVGRFGAVAMPGSEAAVRNPWRMAVSYLHVLRKRRAQCADQLFATIERRLGRQQVSMVTAQIERSLNSPVTSSCGRLFDAVSSLTGICDCADFEGQAAMLLESKAYEYDGGADGAQAREYIKLHDDQVEIDAVGIIGRIGDLLVARAQTARVAYEFHRALADSTIAACRHIAENSGTGIVCLSGGVFQNKLLTELVVQGLEQTGLRSFLQRRVPPNDGGLSLGQAMVAASRDLSLGA